MKMQDLCLSLSEPMSEQPNPPRNVWIFRDRPDPDKPYQYRLSVDSQRIALPALLNDYEFSKEIKIIFDIGMRQAEDVLSGSSDIAQLTRDPSDTEYVWRIQAQAARKQQYLGCEIETETGTIIAVEMTPSLKCEVETL